MRPEQPVQNLKLIPLSGRGEVALDILSQAEVEPTVAICSDIGYWKKLQIRRQERTQMIKSNMQ